jgi:hypothetical protein
MRFLLVLLLLVCIVDSCKEEDRRRYKAQETIGDVNVVLTDFYLMPDRESMSLVPSYQELSVYGHEFTFDSGTFRVVDVVDEKGTGRVFLLALGTYGYFVGQVCATGELIYVCDFLEIGGAPWVQLEFSSDESRSRIDISVDYGLSAIDSGKQTISKGVRLARNLDECGF